MSSAGDIWAELSRDPRVEGNGVLRASDRDRGLIVQVLTEAYADGRLDRDELDDRTERVAAARTLGELPALIDDLVSLGSPAPGALVRGSSADPRALAETRWRVERRRALVAFLAPTILSWAVWLAGSFESDDFEPYFAWPLIVMAATGIRLLRTITDREGFLDDEVRRLTKQTEGPRARPTDEGSA